MQRQATVARMPDPADQPLAHRIRGGHWLMFDAERYVAGCNCGFVASPDDAGYGDSVLDHFEQVVRAEGRPNAAVILAWCDHIEHNATPNRPRDRDPRVNAYADGFRDGVLELLAQVRQAVLHDFDVAALDGKCAYVEPA